MYGLGFTFNDRHSSEFNLIAQSDDRSLLPGKRKNEFVIPGRDGAVDYGKNKYDKRIITMKVTLVNRKLPNLRETSRSVAKWLSGEGLLIFDDEPNKGYRAKVYAPLSIEFLLACGETSVPFECHPFAETPNYNQVNDIFSDKPHHTPVSVNGTQDTPCIIYIKNMGGTDITNITITRKASE